MNHTNQCYYLTFTFAMFVRFILTRLCGDGGALHVSYATTKPSVLTSELESMFQLKNRI